MNKIYETQTELKLRALTEVDVTDALDTRIKYKKPDGTESYFPAEVEDALKGILFYDVLGPTDIVGIGRWTLWAHVTFANGRYAAGEPFTMEVFEEGTTR